MREARGATLGARRRGRSRHGLLNHSDNQHWIGRLKAPPDRRTCANKNLCALILSADHTSADQGKARRIVVGA
jgi:hypothetical protein